MPKTEGVAFSKAKIWRGLHFEKKILKRERSVILCLCSILFRHIKMIKLCILKDSYEQILKDYTKSFLLTNIRIRTTI